MGKLVLYEYVIMLQPTDAEIKEGVKPELISGPNYEFGKDDKAIFMLAVKSLDEKYSNKLDQIDIVIRPF